MSIAKRFFRGFLAVVLLVGSLAGCAPYYGYPASPHYAVAENPPAGSGDGILKVGPEDAYYILRVDDRSAFGAYELPESRRVLYQKGYDEVRREGEADFVLDIAISAAARDNPNVRAGNVLSGALLGAAAGALIGTATGSPARGAAIGAASGGALGLVSPAATPMVQIDISVRGLRDGSVSSKSATIDMATVPPPHVRRVIDRQVARMLDTLPGR